jgi:electron transfer flavoprotein alpha subunit
MGNVLVVVESAGGHVRTASLHAVTFGKKMAELHGGKLHLLVAGQGVDAAAAEAAKLGAAEVLVADAPELAHPLAETWATAVAQAAKDVGATVVAATATAVGKDVLPRAAALLDCGMVSDVVAITAANRFRRPVLYGSVLAEVEVSTPTIVATCRQTEFPPAAAEAAVAPIRKLALTALDARGATFVSLSAQKSDRPELTEAKIVVSGGRGMREGKNFEGVAALADLLGGAMGASRAACDAGMVPNDLQVGQTGKVVAPNLYIAIAISGAIQHLAGMKGSKVIVAINKDAEAPIFQVADYGLVDTWEKALPALTAEVKKLKEAAR